MLESAGGSGGLQIVACEVSLFLLESRENQGPLPANRSIIYNVLPLFKFEIMGHPDLISNFEEIAFFPFYVLALQK